MTATNRNSATGTSLNASSSYHHGNGATQRIQSSGKLLQAAAAAAKNGKAVPVKGSHGKDESGNANSKTSSSFVGTASRYRSSNGGPSKQLIGSTTSKSATGKTPMNSNNVGEAQ